MTSDIAFLLRIETYSAPLWQGEAQAATFDVHHTPAHHLCLQYKLLCH